MGDAIHSFLADYEHGQDDAGYHPAQHHQQPARANCCCGNAACAFLKHNQTALDGLEKDVSTAARLGKVRFLVFCYCRYSLSLSVCVPFTFPRGTLVPFNVLLPFLIFLSCLLAHACDSRRLHLSSKGKSSRLPFDVRGNERDSSSSKQPQQCLSQRNQWKACQR